VPKAAAAFAVIIMAAKHLFGLIQMAALLAEKRERNCDIRFWHALCRFGLSYVLY
jgi:hypothetical protein